jgi:microcystin-dependent protein
MTSVTAYTAQRMKAIEDNTVISGAVVGNNLILTKFNSTTINAGSVIGPQGIQGVPGEVSLAQLNQAVPAGAITMWPFAAIPTGWLELNGQAILNAHTAVPALFAAAPLGWKVSNTLNLPNMQGRFPVGQNTGDALFDTLQETGGTKDAVVVSHTHTIAAHTHAMPNHSHTFTMGTGGTHTHGVSITSAVTNTNADYVTRLSVAVNNGWATGKYMNPWDAAGSTPLLAGITAYGTSYAVAGMSVSYEASHTHVVSGDTNTTGSGHSHTATVDGGSSGATQVITSQSGATATQGAVSEVSGTNQNLPPYMVMRFIIRAY